MSLRRIILALLTLQAALLDAHFGISHGAAPMAVVLIEGFDHLNLAGIGTKGWTIGANWTAGGPGRFSGQQVNMTPGSGAGNMVKTIPAATTYFGGFALNITAIGTAGTDFYVLRAGAVQTFRLSLNASSQIQVRNSGGTVIATGTTTIIASAWNYVELKAFVNTGTPASGTCEVHLNGVAEIASTAGNFGSASLDSVLLPGNNASQNYHIDDMYILDSTGATPRNTFLGDVRVATIMPTADGAHTQWTPDSGSAHFSRVNETIADGDTSYVSDATPNDLDSYAFADIDGGATVYGLQVNLFARKDDAATRQIANLQRQASTDYVGSTVTLSSTYATYSQIFNQDPTAADWTPTTVNADEFGIKEIA